MSTENQDSMKIFSVNRFDFLTFAAPLNDLEEKIFC